MYIHICKHIHIFDASINPNLWCKHLYYKVRCVCVCLSTLECLANYSSSFDAMGYPRVPMAFLWPNRGNKPNWGKIWAKNFFFFKKIPYVIPSALLSFLWYYCHSFRTVIPSVLLSFLLYYCHYFCIIVIPSVLLSFFPYYCH